MITQDEAVKMAREVGAMRGSNFKGADVSLDSYWCAAPDGCDCGKVGEDEVCTKPTKGVYLSDDALTAFANAVWKHTLLVAAKFHEQQYGVCYELRHMARGEWNDGKSVGY